MKPPLRLSLRLLLGLLVFTIESAVLLPLGFHYYRRFSTEVNERLEDTLARPGTLLSQGALSVDSFGQRDTLQRLVGPALVEALIVSADGIVLVSLDAAQIGQPWRPPHGEIATWREIAGANGHSLALRQQDQSFRVRIAPVAVLGGAAPALYSYVAIRTTENERELAQLRRHLLGGSIAAILLTTLALLWVTNHLIARRLERVAKAVAQVTAGTYPPPLTDSGPGDEIHRLAHDVNTMVERLRTSIEELQRHHTQTAQTQKMELVGRLAGGVAHDFNNMLQAILGNVELALHDLPPTHPHHEPLTEIRSAARRSADLTRQLLAFARKQTATPRVVDLNTLVTRLSPLLRRLLGETILLETQPADDLWRTEIDPTQFDQVLTNLCVNARDAIGERGRIVIATHNLCLDETYARVHPEIIPGDYVQLSVSDTGCGMDAATLAHIFEPFFTTKADGLGTGLGLATVFGIVQQNRGFIHVYSEPGQGSTFKLYLPRSTLAPEPAGPSLPPAPRGAETILLVEDEPQVLQLGARLLSRQGYRVLTAISPSAALALVARDRPALDLLITDVIMPEMNGRELADRLRAERPRLRCLFVSGYAADIVSQQGIVDGPLAFVQKPFTGEELLHKVREVLAGP